MDLIAYYGTGTRFSRIVAHNGTAYFSGLTGDNWTGDIESQTVEVLAKADELLAEIGVNRNRLLSATIWLRDIEDFSGMNKVWEAWIDADHPPARATVEARMAAPDIRVEIQFIVAMN